MPSALRPSAARPACFIALLCACGCATEPLTATAPKDVDLTGEWQLDTGLSDDPAHLQDINPDSGGPKRGRGGRGGGRGGPGGPGGPGGGGGGFGMPGGAGGPSGGGIGAPELLAASGSSTRAAAGASGGTDPGSFGIGPSNAPGTVQPNPNGGGATASGPAPGAPGGAGGAAAGGRRAGAGNLLAAPDRMTIEQSGGRLRIQMRLPGGALATEEYTFGAKGTVAVGQNTAEQNVGWNGAVLVIETRFKSGPSKEADYALDDSGHLIMTTLVSGGHVRKTELKRVYDRVTPGH